MKKYGVNTSSQIFRKRYILNIRKEQYMLQKIEIGQLSFIIDKTVVTRIDKPAGKRLFLNRPKMRTQSRNFNECNKI